MRRTATIGLTAAAVLAAGAGSAIAATPHAPGPRSFTETESGTQLSTTGLRAEDLFKVKSGPFLRGSVIRDFVFTGSTFPVSGKDAATSYYRDGRLSANETVMLGAPQLDGVGPLTGTGTCVSGTKDHLHETCTYKIKGSYDLVTGRMYMTLTGTYTPATTTAPAKKKK